MSIWFSKNNTKDVYRILQRDEAAETCACEPGFNANTSPCSGQMNCFLSWLLLFGLTPAVSASQSLVG